MAESRRIVRLYMAQQEERRKRTTSQTKTRGNGNPMTSSESTGPSRSLNVFSSSPKPQAETVSGSSSFKKDFSREQPSSSVAAVTAAAAAALYGTSPSAISEAKADLIEASQLPSEAKTTHMCRLMSATLIELTSKDTLAMVTCADGVWDNWRMKKSEETFQTNTSNLHGRLSSVAERPNGFPKGPKETNTSKSLDASGSDRLVTVWPEAAYGRFVSEETVNAVMRLIIGDWGPQSKQNDPSNESVYSGGAEDISIVIPEGLVDKKRDSKE